MEFKEKRIKPIIVRLKKAYPGAKTALHHRNPFELLAATILSAQCTDERVNKVTPSLFKRFPDAKAMAKANKAELESLIRSTGFYHNKAKNLLGMAQTLAAQFSGEVPKNMPDLLTLPGVARKTANVVLGSAFGIAEGIVVDTHVKRLSQRLGFSRQQQPEKIEQDLMRLVPRQDWIAFGHLLITHGRRICFARKPACADCALQELCPSAFAV
jgi:endonuclease-3